MQYTQITTPQDLDDFCQRLSEVRRISFDTEFVSEDTFRPDLCLVQVAAGGEYAIIDPQTCGDMAAFWRELTDDRHEVIVHAGREEMRFALHSVGKTPANLIDVQIAAGLIGFEYPASYGNLVSRTLGESLGKGETRTNWRRRPLTTGQLEYALQDVLYLEGIADKLLTRIEQLDRSEWLAAEMNAFRETVTAAEQNGRWRKVSGSGNLNSRSLAIVRELWHWRQGEAERRNCPARRVLRDDLIVELARRKSSDENRMANIRGMERSGLRRHLPQLAACVEKAMQLPDSECPKRNSRKSTPQLNLVGQFLATALSGICRNADVAPALVGSASDVRDLVANILEADAAAEPPSLALGWRAEVVGKRIEELLRGETSIAIGAPLAEQPLLFEPRTPSK